MFSVPWHKTLVTNKIEYIDEDLALQTLTPLPNRLVVSASQKNPSTIMIQSPTTGWPQTGRGVGNPFSYVYTVGVPLTHHKRNKIREMLVLAVRELYNGSRDISANHVLSTFLQPLKEVE